jgi:peptidoglycan hydrolase CwlO-like protein
LIKTLLTAEKTSVKQGLPVKKKAFAIATVIIVSILVTALFVYSQVSELQNQINELQAQNSDLQNQIGELQAQNSELQDQITELQDEITDLQTQKSGLQDKLRELLGIPC